MHDYVVERLARMTMAQRAEIGLEAEVPAPTVEKVAHRYTPNPRIKTIERLHRVLRKREQ